MVSMKNVPIALGLILTLGLLGLTIGTTPLAADSTLVKWLRVNIPTEGKAGNWVLAGGSDVQHLTMTIDSTLYCYADPSGTSYTLFKSSDQGKSWSYTGKVTDNIVAIATAPDDAKVIYYATSSQIYKSTDAGSKFNQLIPNPGGAGSDNIVVTSIDVAKLGKNNIIVVGTRNTDNLQFGGVYVLDENKPFSGWVDTNLGIYDIYAVAFSPNFATDWQLVAVVTNESNTLVTTKIGDADWGKTIGDATLVAFALTDGDIAFPDDYNSNVITGTYVQFVAITTGSDNGDVYRIDGAEAPSNSVATDLNIGSDYGLSNVDVTSLAITGNGADANLLAGAAGSAQVYYSTDGGRNWTRSIKEPTGQSKTYMLMAPDFTRSGRAYAATSGTESAFSFTEDAGVTWNQLGLIDTTISDFVDLAQSPNYSQDNTLFMLTHKTGGEHSLWRSLNSGTSWERLYSSALANVDSMSHVALSPQYGDTSQVVFIAGKSNNRPVIWKSIDGGQNFSPAKPTSDRTTGASFNINVWVVVNDTTLFIGSYDGTSGLVYHTTNSGSSYSEGAVVGNRSLNSVVLSPNYDEDETMLVGNTNGWVYWSDDSTSFEPLPPDATSPPLTGKITVAFDPDYSQNNTVYASSDTADEGIYRFIIGTRTAWESIDSTLPSGGMVSQLMASADGTLYATNLEDGGGMERCLNPTYPLGPTFETVTRGLSDNVTLWRLWQCDNRLWSVDTFNTWLMTYNDSLAQPVTLASPPEKASGVGTIINYNISNASLDWEALSGTTSYKWQLDHDTDFSSVPTGFEASTKASSARLPELEPATTYYWRVRTTEPVLSQWSAKWSFTTSIGTAAIAPQLSSPEAGASGAPVKPIFQWSAIAGADSYELLVSTEASFANPIIVKIGDYALPATAWQCDLNLNYDTTYYWKVRAGGSNTQSDWSGVGAFTTESPPKSKSSSPPESSPPKSEPNPAPSAPPPSAPPPPAPAQPTTPEWTMWLMFLGGAMLLTMLAMLITLIILTVKAFKS